MTQEQRIGQLLMVAVPVDDLASWRSVLGDQPAGGVFLAGRSTASAAALGADIAEIQRGASDSAGAPLHVAVDQEGGYVQSLRGPDFPSVATAVDQGQESTAALARITRGWSEALVTAGVTLDLAPVADTVPAGTADDNPPIGAQDRQYGSTPGAVAGSVGTVISAMRSANLGSTVKHFPGLGRVTANTDTSADAVDDRTTSDDPALEPFRAAIAAGTTAVMVSSALYPQLDPDHIAAFSRPIITGLLRGQLHFDGLVISDDLGNAVAVSDVSVGQRAVDFVTAGGDMALTVQPNDFSVMLAALRDRAAGSSTFRARVDDAALHVLASKETLGLLRC
jgi:beta-N-acetylhexosaminidase